MRSIYIFISLLLMYLLTLNSIANAQTSEIKSDIQCIGQTTEGTPIRVTINMTLRELTFEGKKWPISAAKYSTDGTLMAASTDAAGYPGTYFTIAVKGTSGVLIFYRDGNLKSSTELICQDTK